MSEPETVRGSADHGCAQRVRAATGCATSSACPKSSARRSRSSTAAMRSSSPRCRPPPSRPMDCMPLSTAARTTSHCRACRRPSASRTRRYGSSCAVLVLRAVAMPRPSRSTPAAPSPVAAIAQPARRTRRGRARSPARRPAPARPRRARGALGLVEQLVQLQCDVQRHRAAERMLQLCARRSARALPARAAAGSPTKVRDRHRNCRAAFVNGPGGTWLHRATRTPSPFPSIEPRLLRLSRPTRRIRG